MNFRDQWITNENGEKFLFTVEMQRQLGQAGLPITPEAWQTFAAQPARPARGGHEERRVEERRREPAAAPARPREPRETPPESPPQDNKTYPEPISIQIDPMSGKYIGRLKWYNPLRGYGFIARGGGEDIFFHKTDALSDPADMPEGQWILYDVEDTERGLEASDVEIYTGEPPQD
jgi:cold shock CspA family protein